MGVWFRFNRKCMSKSIVLLSYIRRSKKLVFINEKKLRKNLKHLRKDGLVFSLVPVSALTYTMI